MCAFIVKSESGSDSRGESFVNQIDPATTCIVCSISNRALLNCSRRAGNTDDKMATPVPTVPLSHFRDAGTQHLPRDFEIEDRAGTDWPVYFDTAWLAAK